MSELIKMELSAYKDEKFKNELKDKKYTLMLNPESLKSGRRVAYNKQQANNEAEAAPKFNHEEPRTLSFDIIIDCTGVVDPKRVDLAVELKKLTEVVYNYNGDIHSPNFVSITWGESITFQGLLDSIDTTYTLFRPDGSPLRAKLSLSFISYVDKEQSEKRKKKNSPDMTHFLDVVEGDSLPTMCEKIWQDAFYYVQVAEFNNLNKFRKLNAGKRIFFPPLKAVSE